MNATGMRNRIDAIDDRIADLLNERLAVAERLGREKRRTRFPVRDLAREAEGLSRIHPTPARAHPLMTVARAITASSVQQQLRETGTRTHPVAVIPVGKQVKIGNGLTFMAGPCSVESRPALLRAARAAKAAGASVLRGGCFKPRTSPYDFQGLGENGLSILKDCGEALSMPVLTEVLDPRDVACVSRHADILQIGSRNMQNVPLLREAAQTGKPILLKRGMAATLDEFAHAAEYLRTEGNGKVILCERGIRTFGTETRFTLDVAAIPILRAWTGLPVVIDPSHAAGYREWVLPLAMAAVAAGADGLLIEVHHQPDRSASDARQTIGPRTFARLTRTGLTIRRSMSRFEGSC